MVYGNDIHTPVSVVIHHMHIHPPIYSKSGTCTHVYMSDVGDQAHAGLSKNVVSA